MSSTLDMSSILSTIASLESQLATLKSQLGGSAVPAVGKKEKAPRKKSDTPRPPTDWRIFSDRIRDLLKNNGYSGKALGTECVQFCSSLKAENADLSSWDDGDVLARRAAWSAPEVSKQAAAGIHYKKGKKIVTPPGSTGGSVVSDAESVSGGEISEPTKKRKPMSDETKATAAAKRKATLAAKKAASSGTTAVVPSSDSALPPLPPSPPQSVAGAMDLKRVMISGHRYLVHLDTGHSWHAMVDSDNNLVMGSDGKPMRGGWAGIFSAPTTDEAGTKIPAKVDGSVPDPNADSDELEF
jgi:hypothetical protein